MFFWLTAIYQVQVGQKFAQQLKVADYHSPLRTQKRALDQSTQPGHFRLTDPILPQLDNAFADAFQGFRLEIPSHSEAVVGILLSEMPPHEILFA